jgi:hypothetical protein
VRAPEDLHGKILKFAEQAGVPYIMPNLYSYDPFNEELKKDQFFGKSTLILAPFKEMNASFISLSCGYWFEWSLGMEYQRACFFI